MDKLDEGTSGASNSPFSGGINLRTVCRATFGVTLAIIAMIFAFAMFGTSWTVALRSGVRLLFWIRACASAATAAVDPCRDPGTFSFCGPSFRCGF